jgi:hypothetical protein
LGAMTFLWATVEMPDGRGDDGLAAICRLKTKPMRREQIGDFWHQPGEHTPLADYPGFWIPAE